MLQLEIRRSHRNAESLELVGAGNAASIVVGEDGNGTAYETAVEHPLAGNEEVIAVNETYHGEWGTGNGERGTVNGEWGTEAVLAN